MTSIVIGFRLILQDQFSDTKVLIQRHVKFENYCTQAINLTSNKITTIASCSQKLFSLGPIAGRVKNKPELEERMAQKINSEWREYIEQIY